jgi:hypothetical protein
MRRRDLIALLGGAVATWLAVGVRAQPGKIFRLGILVNTRNTALDELLKELRDYGYVEGQNLIVEPGILGPKHGSVGVDLVEPGYELEWSRDDMGPRFYFSDVHQRKVFPRDGRPSVAITIQR